MIQRVTLLLLLIAVAVGAYSWSTASKFQEQEAQIRISPNGKWAVHLMTGSNSLHNRPLSKIQIFATSLYPELANVGTFPSRSQRNNPYAEHIFASGLFARAAEFKWSTDGDVLTITQDINGKVLRYELELNSGSFVVPGLTSH